MKTLLRKKPKKEKKTDKTSTNIINSIDNESHNNIDDNPHIVHINDEKENYKILNSFKEGIVLFDKNYKIKWKNDFIHNIMESPIDFPIEELSKRILSIKQDTNYVKFQQSSLKEEEGFRHFFKAFQTKVACFKETTDQEINELKAGFFSMKSQKIESKTSQIISRNFSKTSTNINISSKLSTFKAINTHTKIKKKLKIIHLLNNNGNFESLHNDYSLHLKSLRDYMKDIFNKEEDNLQEISMEDIDFEKFNMYGRYDYGDNTIDSLSRMFSISFFPYHNEIFVVLKPLNNNDLIISSINNNLKQNRLLASMCHELRTPLNSITNMLELMETDLQHNEKDLSNNEYLNNALTNSNLLLSSINDFLDYFSINSHIFELELEEFNLKKMCQEIFELFHFIAAKKNINFELIFDETASDLCYNDSKRLRQILLNLINNAFKFTIEGSIIFKIKQKNHELFKISVEDSGFGMDASIFKSLANFHFINENNETTGGFGLCITNHLVNYIGPQMIQRSHIFKGLKLKTELGKGSKFSFFLRNTPHKKILDVLEPCESLKNISYDSVPFESEKNIIAMTRVEYQNNCKFLSSINNLRNLMVDQKTTCECFKLLAVDDNEFNLFVLTEKFKKKGIYIDIAHSGDESINKISDYLYEKPNSNLKFCQKCKFYKLILMDIDMPVKNGYETTVALKNLFQIFDLNIPIIALSAFSQNNAKEKAFESGMISFIEKPFSHEKLEIIAKKYLL